jgi:hypothetical protein
MDTEFLSEISSKRRRGFPSETRVKRGFPSGSLLQGASREARTERSVPVRVWAQISKTAACEQAITMDRFVTTINDK